MPDSLIIDETIELLGGRAVSKIAECQGAQFQLAPGWSKGAAQPEIDITAALALDGEIPLGERMGNRTFSIPVVIQAPNRIALAAAREFLLRTVSKKSFTLRWTREGSTLPTIFDCFKAGPAQVTQSLPAEHSAVASQVTLTFPAKPYGRSDTPEILEFQSPVSGATAPPSPVVIDTYAAVAGVQWSASPQSPLTGCQSAFWDPGASPANNPGGIGLTPVYSKTGLSLNLAQGWNFANQGNPPLANNYYVATPANAAKVKVGDTFQVWNPAGSALVYTTIFTVTNIGPPVAGFQNVTFFPAAPAPVAFTGLVIQTGPPQLSALTFWAGLGSTQFYHHWCRAGGRVTFTFTLTDTYGQVITFSKTVSLSGSEFSSAPKWTKVKIKIPYSALFDYQNVTGYTLTTINRTTGFHYSHLYVSQLTAVPPPFPAVSPVRGTVYELAGLLGSARALAGLQFQRSGSQLFTKPLFTPGAGQWLCPPGVFSVSVFMLGPGCNGAAFGGNGGGGGGGGGSAFNAAIAVTPGNLYNFFVGTIGNNLGDTSSTTWFQGDAVTLTAQPGQPGTISAGGLGGAAGPGGFAGGQGGNGTGSGTGGGGAGGNSAGTGANGNPGGNASGSTGGVPAAAVAGGYQAGRGGTFNIGNGGRPPGGYGSGGGGSPGGAFGTQTGKATGGLIQITYTTNTPAFQTLLVHRPPKDAPDSLVPFVSPGPSDVPDGNTNYVIQSLVSGVNARFGGTYTVVAVAWSWDNPTAPRNITVSVNQVEQPGGAVYTASTTATITPSTLPATPGTNAGNGPFVIIGEITLPANEIPPDNLNAYFSANIISGNTNDRFLDILFLDTMGSSVAIESPVAYVNYYLDIPQDTRDIGFVLGSLYGRADAVSVLDRAVMVSGGPMSVDPYGSHALVVYAAEGPPNCRLIYHPSWFEDRLA